MSEITDQDMAEALDRIARTPDGEVLYLYLQKALMGVPTSTEACALTANHGRRSFASELMGFMSKGISASARSGCITFAVAQRSAVPRRIPGGRLVSADTLVPGYDAPDSDARSRPGVPAA